MADLVDEVVVGVGHEETDARRQLVHHHAEGPDLRRVYYGERLLRVLSNRYQ